MWIRLRTLLALVAPLVMVGLATGQRADRPNIVLFVADDLGCDLGCYGNPAARTPHLDRLAADAVRFDRAFVTTASCSPSRSVILSGLYNHANGQYGLAHAAHHFSGHDDVPSMPKLLKAAGYRTGRVGKFHVLPEEAHPFDQTLRGGNSIQMVENAAEFIAADRDTPFFLYWCTHDPHRSGVAKDLPLRPNLFGNRPPGESHVGETPVVFDPKDVVVPPWLPDTPTCRAELAQYLQSVARIDQAIGRLLAILDESGQRERTVLVITSDHGPPFPGAKTTVYDPGLRVPLIVWHPEGRRGVATDELTSQVDLLPTLLDIAGAPLPAPTHDAEGRSFLPAVLGTEHTERDAVFASHTFHEVTMYYPMRAIRTATHKLIVNFAHELPFPFASDLWEASTWQEAWRGGEDARYGARTIGAYLHRPRIELYDLVADPLEVHDLAGDPQHAALRDQLIARVQAFERATKDPWALKWRRE